MNKRERKGDRPIQIRTIAADSVELAHTAKAKTNSEKRRRRRRNSSDSSIGKKGRRSIRSSVLCVLFINHTAELAHILTLLFFKYSLVLIRSVRVFGAKHVFIQMLVCVCICFCVYRHTMSNYVSDPYAKYIGANSVECRHC